MMQATPTPGASRFASPSLRLSFSELSARERVAHLLDAGSFTEILGPAERVVSPHLALLGVPFSFDDGVVVGSGTLQGRPVLIAAQEGEFMGGGVGEVHGAKLVGILRRALLTRPAAVLVLAESGGVRLHEANAGLIAVSEVMRAVLDVRAAGIPVVMLIGGANGCFGGMGLIARCADHIVMSDAARMSMSGPLGAPNERYGPEGVTLLGSGDRPTPLRVERLGPRTFRLRYPGGAIAALEVKSPNAFTRSTEEHAYFCARPAH